MITHRDAQLATACDTCHRVELGVPLDWATSSAEEGAPAVDPGHRRQKPRKIVQYPVVKHWCPECWLQERRDAGCPDGPVPQQSQRV